MTVRVVSTVSQPQADGESQYNARLVAELRASGIPVAWHTIAEWKAGTAKGDPAHDVVVVAAQDAAHIQQDYAVVAVQHDCSMVTGLRCRTVDDIAVGRQQAAVALRKHTFWVACSDWSAYHYRLHTGVRADRIIYGGVDVDTFIPSERQRLRDAKTPIVLHGAVDSNSGQHLIAGLTKALKGAVELREVSGDQGDVAQALRGGDMWLSMRASDGRSTRVIEAMSCGLIVVGTNVGVLWPYTRGVPTPDGPLLGWLNKEVGGVVFSWQQRDYPEAIAHHIRTAWHHRKHLGAGRDFARQWWSLETFGRKWLEVLWLVSERFGLGSVSAPAAAATTPPTGRESRARDAR